LDAIPAPVVNPIRIVKIAAPARLWTAARQKMIIAELVMKKTMEGKSPNLRATKPENNLPKKLAPLRIETFIRVRPDRSVY
jgi:hypothetical protein